VKKPQTFSITTLGCKVNQSESDAIARQLQEAGLTPAGKGHTADLCIVNTCTVTGKASMQSRQSVRQAVRGNPGGRVIVTGCYAQTAPEKIAGISGVDAVIGQHRKHCVADLALGRTCERSTESHRALEALPAVQSGRGRPFLKIQDGCESFCTYCIVPYTRGPSRSVPPQAVLDSLRQIHANGYAEAVLTGIHLGLYGRDLTPDTDLAALLERIGRESAIHRVRLSSIEPGELSGEILRQAAGSGRSGRICPHFHIPLQSGDPEILRRMGRPYTPSFFTDLVAEIRSALPDAAIGSDVLVGFPGESEAAFQNTLETVAGAPLTYLHVFPFSPRKGTPAYRFSNRVAASEIKDRCRRLREIGVQKKFEFYRRFIAKPLEVVLETKVGDDLWLGTSENYIPVQVQAKDGAPGRAVMVRGVKFDSNRFLTAVPVSDRSEAESGGSGEKDRTRR